MERIDDDVEIWQLSLVTFPGRWFTYHSSYSKVRTDALFLSVLLDIVEGIYTRGDQVTCLVVVQFLYVS